MPPTSPRVALGSVGLVVLGLIGQEVGASFAVLLFPSTGAFGMATLRLSFSAVFLLVIARPKLRGHGRDGWLTVVAFGLVLAAMNCVFYSAIDRIPLGAAVTIEVLGPIVLSVIVSRRLLSWLWAALALAGVVLLGRGSFGDLDPLGVVLAAAAGVTWACYILLSSRTGQRFPKLDGLAIAMTIGAVVSAPVGIVTAGAAIVQPRNLLLGAAVAGLSSAIPYGLELIALRRIHAATLSILMSLTPAIATGAGFLILAQGLDLFGAIAIALVMAASVGAVRSAALAGRRPAEPRPAEAAASDNIA